ncbi:MAG: hypothetical protein SFH39_06360 [Candidatus Magnetobacterium sp. LHC-1]
MGSTGTDEYRCPNCEKVINTYATECPSCWTSLTRPNVREAQRDPEQDPLQERYSKATQKAKNYGIEAEVSTLEGHVRASFAVINLRFGPLFQLLNDEKIIYSSYERQVDAQTRVPAEKKFDVTRRQVGEMLFGGAAKNICYAALSIDGSGLKNYGEYTIRLKDNMICSRATLLEDNSYRFAEKHGINTQNITDSNIPNGFRALWSDRHKIAVAKLVDQVKKGFTFTDYAKILLDSRERKCDDDFIEVHIYGGFNILEFSKNKF